MAFAFTLVEPPEMIRARSQVGIGSHGDSRDHGFMCQPDWKPLPLNLAMALGVSPSTSRCFGAHLPIFQTRVSAKGPWIQHPCLLWNGSNRIRMDRPGDAKGIPLWFDFVLPVAPRPNRDLCFLGSMKSPSSVGGDNKMGVFMADMNRLAKQEEWMYVGDALTTTVVCSANPCWRLMLVIRKTVQKRDGEPLMLFTDRSYALTEFIAIHSPGSC